MKIVILPGVGFTKIEPRYEYFLEKITKGLGCEGEIYCWEHQYEFPEITLPYKDVREFVCEVILDFQQVVVHALDMKIPEADLYIGHSAGSVLALAQYDKPSVILASPSTLVELIQGMHDDKTKEQIIELMTSHGERPILNIINKYDVLAYPLTFSNNNVENHIYSGNVFNPFSYIPLTCHTHYWKSNEVIEKIINTVNGWKDEKKMYNINLCISKTKEGGKNARKR